MINMDDFINIYNENEVKGSLASLEKYRKKLVYLYRIIDIFSILIALYIIYLVFDEEIQKIYNNFSSMGFKSIVFDINNFIKGIQINQFYQKIMNGNLSFSELYLYLSFIFSLPVLIIILYSLVMIPRHMGYAILDYVVLLPLKIIFNFSIEDLNYKYKKYIIKTLVEKTNNRLEYYPQKKIEAEQIEESNLFNKKFSKIEGDNYVEGYIGKTEVKFSEVNVLKSTGKNGYKSLFKGIYLIGDFNKNIIHNTLLKGKEKNKKFFEVFNFFNIYKIHLVFYLTFLFFKTNIFIAFLIAIFCTTLYKFIRSKLKRIKLENMEFEELYDVYGENEIEARYILTPSFMERLVALQKKTKSIISLSFVNSKVNIIIPYQENLFELKIKKSLICNAEKHYNIVQLLTGIVDDLDLNKRIWTKRSNVYKK